MNQELELKNVVRNLRKDLQALDEEGQGKDLKFKVEAIDLELKVAAKQTDGVDGGIKFYVFNLGASDKAESEQALTIKQPPSAQWFRAIASNRPEVGSLSPALVQC